MFHMFSSSACIVQGAVKPQDVVRMYDSLAGSCKEWVEVAAQMGGSAGELLMDECSAKVSFHGPPYAHDPVTILLLSDPHIPEIIAIFQLWMTAMHPPVVCICRACNHSGMQG